MEDAKLKEELEALKNEYEFDYLNIGFVRASDEEMSNRNDFEDFKYLLGLQVGDSINFHIGIINPLSDLITSEIPWCFYRLRFPPLVISNLWHGSTPMFGTFWCNDAAIFPFGDKIGESKYTIPYVHDFGTARYTITKLNWDKGIFEATLIDGNGPETFSADFVTVDSEDGEKITVNNNGIEVILRYVNAYRAIT